MVDSRSGTRVAPAGRTGQGLKGRRSGDGRPLLFTAQIEALFGEVSGTNPVFILAVYSPAIAAVLMVWRHHGTTGSGRYLRRATLWRIPAGWWLALVLGIPAVKYLGAAINGTWTDFPSIPGPESSPPWPRPC